MFKTKQHFLSGLSAIALTGGEHAMAGSALADVNPYAKPNQADITLSGEVITQVGDELTVDYGDGVITVEMDDWDWHNEAAWIQPGETITVTGEIDDDLYQLKTIEAETVYVIDRSTYYYASDTDEEDAAYWTYATYDPATAPEGTWFGLSGTVNEIDGSEFVLNTGYNMVRVETAYLDYNPLDEEGFQQVETGDRIYVSGTLDDNFFNKNEIDANSIITLKDESAS